MNRDNIIDEKIQSLKELEKKIKDKLENQEKFITNLKVGSINLRTVNNEEFLKVAEEIDDIVIPENVKIFALGEATHANKEFQELKLDYEQNGERYIENAN